MCSVQAAGSRPTNGLTPRRETHLLIVYILGFSSDFLVILISVVHTLSVEMIDFTQFGAQFGLFLICSIWKRHEHNSTNPLLLINHTKP